MLPLMLLFALNSTAEKIAEADALIAQIQKTAAPHVEERARVTKLLREAVEEAPHDDAVIEKYLSWLSREDIDAFAKTALPLVREAHDPDAVRHNTKFFYLNGKEALLADALRRDPKRGPLWKELVDEYYDPQISATFGPVQVSTGTLRPEWKSIDDAGVLESAERQIDALSQLDRARDLLVAVDALPAAIRTRVLAGDVGAVQKQLPDVRLDIALAAFLSDDVPRAKSILASFDRQHGPEWRAKVGEARKNILTALMANGSDDPFDLLADVIGNSNKRPWSGLWAEATGMIADRGGYARLACTIRSRAASHQLLHLNHKALEYLAPAMLSELKASEARTPSPVSCGLDSFSAQIDRLLQQPRIAQYREKPLSAAPLPGTPANVSLPKGWWTVRAEREGDEVVAIAFDQATGTGYWIFDSKDGGNSWQQFYTGLHGHTYRVIEHSKQKMLAGDHLDVEVTVQEYDQPYTGGQLLIGRMTRQASGIALEIPWELLRRDSDRDGVTDLEEELAVTDPFRPDAKASGEPSPESEVVARVLHHAGRDKSRYLFISGDRDLFADMKAGAANVVVLTRDQWKRYYEKYGFVNAIDPSYTFVSRDGTKAMTVFLESSSEESYLLTKSGDAWTIQQTEMIVS